MTTATTQPNHLTNAQAKAQAERILSDYCDRIEAQDAAKATTQPKPQPSADRCSRTTTQPDPAKVAIVERALDRIEGQLAALGFVWTREHGWVGPAQNMEAARKLGVRRGKSLEDLQAADTQTTKAA